MADESTYWNWRDELLKHPEGRATGGEPCVKCGQPVPSNTHWKHRDRHVCSRRCNLNLNRQFNRLASKVRDGNDARWRNTTMTGPPSSAINPRVSGPRHFATRSFVSTGEVPYEWEGYCPLEGDTVERHGVVTSYTVMPANPAIPENHRFHGNLYVAAVASGHVDIWGANDRGELRRLHWGSLTPEGELFSGEFVCEGEHLRWTLEFISDVTPDGFEYRWEAPVAVPTWADENNKFWSPAYRANSDRKRRISANAARHERRLRLDNPKAEKFDPQEIYERDGWICALCEEPVDPTLRWPHERSASLDHTLPLAAGGAHTRSNTQLAHLVCNIHKGTRTF